jgi:cytochrome c peroxidase
MSFYIGDDNNQRSLTPYSFGDQLRFFPPMPTAKNNQLTVEGAELGRYLFYDPILSIDSSFSCASCHRQENAFSDSPKRFSTGVNGDTLSRNTPPLFNLAWYPQLFWDGRANSLEDQVFHPVRDTSEMNLSWENAAQRVKENDFYRQKFRDVFGNTEIDSVLIARAIAQFERTIISANSKYDKVLRREDYFTPKEYEGFVIANDQTKGDCLHCHTSDANALGTTGEMSNNGLQEAFQPEDFKDKGQGETSNNKDDIGKFKIPSFRNVALTAPYMHDGRFQTLEEVVDFYSEGVHESHNIDSKMEFAHRGGVHLTEEEKESLIAFLYTMTDSTLITDEKFSSPF